MHGEERTWIHSEGERLRQEDAFDFEEGVRLEVNRAPGTKGCDLRFHATSGIAAVKGLALLVIRAAQLMGVDVGHIISLLAVILLGPMQKEGQP